MNAVVKPAKANDQQKPATGFVDPQIEPFHQKNLIRFVSDDQG
jgi:hypothetical protein